MLSNRSDNDIKIFKMAALCSLEFSLFNIFVYLLLFRSDLPLRILLHAIRTIRHRIAKNDIFHYGVRPPSWIRKSALLFKKRHYIV